MLDFKKDFSEEFFVIDTNNLDIIKEKLYGYIIQNDGKVIFNQNFISDNNLSGMGAYLYCEVDEEFITIYQDFNGSYGLYLFEDEDYFAISNSFIKLVDHIKFNHEISLNEDYANSFLFTDLCTIAYEDTLINEIKLLPRDIKIKINKINKTIYCVGVDFKEHTLSLDSSEGIQALDKWFYKWVNIFRLVKSQTNNIIVNLSGGFDTRVVAALWLSANIDLSKIRIYSIDDDKSVHREDYKIASKIAEHFNFKLNRGKITAEKILYENIDIPVNNSFYLKLGFHNQMYYKPRLYKEPIYTVAGLAGECIRGYPNKTSEEYLNDLNKRIKNYDKKLADSTINVLESSWKTIKDKFNISYKSTDLPERHYKEVRNRHHYGKAQVELYLSNEIPLNPLLDPDLHKINLTTSQCNDKHLLIALIFTRYCPDLLNFEVEGGRKIKESTREYAERLNSKFEFNYEMKSMVTGPELDLTFGNSTNELGIDESDIEKYFKDIFYSKKFEMEYKKYFSEKSYYKIADEIENKNFHPLTSFYAALSILKAMNDVKLYKLKQDNYDLKWTTDFLDQNKENINNAIKTTLKSDIIKYATARIDIKNFGDAENNVEMLENSDNYSKNQYPNWFSNNMGKGLVVESYMGEIDLKIKCIKDGIFKLWLKGIDFRDKNGNRFPIYIHYTNLTINGQKITDDKLVTHDNHFIFQKDVVNSEIVEIHIEWRAMNNLTTYKTND